MSRVKLATAISGLPLSPYTVKNRRHVTGTLYRWEYVKAISSEALFVEAYGEIGWDIGSSSEKGTLLFMPYTEEDDAKTKFFTGCFFTASRRFKVPRQFTSSYKMGSCKDGLTPALAAIWHTTSMEFSLKILFISVLSLISPR